ncbi:MAG TPA: FUSC family protein [Acetobacteraceae bacterium]
MPDSEGNTANSDTTDTMSETDVPILRRYARGVNIASWLNRIDPGTHRRIKGLRLVTSYGIAAMLGTLPDISHGLHDPAALAPLAGGFALWGSVSEAQMTRARSSRDLVLLCAAATLGAIMMIGLGPLLRGPGRPGAEIVLASGAFLVSYLKRHGVLGGGIGSQIFIGQLLAYGAGLGLADLRTVVTAGLIAIPASVVPRLLSGPAEHPALAPGTAPVAANGGFGASPELHMGLQAALAAVVIVGLNDAVGLTQSAWAITACAYVIAGSAAGTMDRVRRRILGTAIGVPIGLACLPIAVHAPLLVWSLAAVAMVIYAMALPKRYDIACGAYAFTLIVTLAMSGEHSVTLLFARAWETLIGGALGLAAAMLLLPLRSTGVPSG